MTIPAISPVQFGRYRFFSYIRINEYLKSIIWKYITLKPVSLTGCWDVSKVYRHAWTGCMRKMRIKGLVSDWTVRMSACALTSLPVPCRLSAIPDGWRSPASSASSITSPGMWRS
ncbi:hypothetical protein GKE84_25525 [Escherichia coli]|nr:hypothetical protein [Escherichia coli]